MIESYFIKKIQQLSLDKILAEAILLIFFISILIDFSNWYTHSKAIILVLATTFYLCFRDSLIHSDFSIKCRKNKHLSKISHVLFFFSISLVLLSLWLSQYTRSIYFFGLIGLALITIVYDILLLDTTDYSRFQCSIIQIKIILIGILVYASIYWEFPGIYGTDSWWHNEWTSELIEFGNISEGTFLRNSYAQFPIFHLNSGIVSILTKVSVYDSIFLSTSFFLALTSIFITVIGTKIFNVKIGLVAGLVTILSDMAINFGSQVFPNTLGFCLFTVIFYVTFIKLNVNIYYKFLFILLSIAVILTHTLSSFIVLLVLCGLFLSLLFYNFSKLNYEGITTSLLIVFFFGLSMFSYWMHAITTSGFFFESSILKLIGSTDISNKILTQTNIQLSFFSRTLPELGYLLLIIFSIIGILVCINKNFRTYERTGLITCVFALFLLPTFLKLLGINLLPERWLLFLYLPLTILAIFGVMISINVFQKNTLKTIGFSLIIIVIVLLMIISPPANGDNPPTFNNAQRLGYTYSEQKTIERLAEFDAGCPKTDLHYGNIFPYIIGNKEYQDMSTRDNIVFIERKYYIFHPEWDSLFITELHEGGKNDNFITGRYVSDYLKGNKISEKSRIYTNEMTNVFAMTDY
ncbi:MAG: hypothetical protein ACYDDV_02115 [Methanoregula sp.]